ncbi:MAG: 4'-phosphopantetheinyl transferase superfamily protein [Holosporaceae bacterium]|jgi:4'-phosphopantetheinyl transferase EntD|nr:4'-phosphopantetheinyl transferase superfamily protein [Holosporaceae bacterium]
MSWQPSIFNIPFFYDGNSEKGVLAIARIADLPAFWDNDYAKLLSAEELERIRSIQSEKVKRQYCFGRILTKKALAVLIGEFAFSDVSILNEKSGCPIIIPSGLGYATSITHSNEIVASFVFKNCFSFGIDVENLRETALEALASVALAQEPVPRDLKNLTIAWTLKESLSKALKSGFRLPFSEFEISSFVQNEDIFSCSYKRYPDFQGIALFDGKNSFAFTYPKKVSVAAEYFNEFLNYFK